MPSDNDEDFATLLAEYDQREKASPRKREPREGESVRGKVISIGASAVFLDLGGKSDGMIDLAELRDQDGELTVRIGDEIEARVVDAGANAGCILLRRTMGKGPGASAELAQAYAHQIPVEGLVTGVNKGGVEVQIAGVRGFCPISQLELRHVEDASRFVGQKLSFRITRLEEAGRSLNLVLSRKVLLEEEGAVRAAETRGKLSVGAVVSGVVTALKDYGAFVDLGGIEGMIHMSEMSFQRVGRAEDLLAVGQEVSVQVVRIEQTDDPRRPEKVALSLKSLERDPWTDVAERFPEGTRAKGTVVRLETFGAFVELAPGIQGLAHVSELGAKRAVRHAREVVKVGDQVEVTVLGVDREKHRISLSLGGESDASAGERAMPPGPQPTLGTFGDLLRGGGGKKPRK